MQLRYSGCAAILTNGQGASHELHELLVSRSCHSCNSWLPLAVLYFRYVVTPTVTPFVSTVIVPLRPVWSTLAPRAT